MAPTDIFSMTFSLLVFIKIRFHKNIRLSSEHVGADFHQEPLVVFITVVPQDLRYFAVYPEILRELALSCLDIASLSHQAAVRFTPDSEEHHHEHT